MPKISVGMPVYNGDKYVEESIRSVLAQTFGDFELLISDNGSTDHTGDICQQYASSDSRINYWRNETNIGAAGNYNLLFRKASAPYFRWSNADDLLHPTLHERCLEALESNPGAVLAAGETVLIDALGNVTDTFDDNLDITHATASERLKVFFERVSLTNVIYGLMRTAALEKTDLMGNGTIPAADTILMGQLVMHGQFLKIPEPLFYRRMHEQSSSADRDNKDVQQAFWSAGASKFRRPCSRRMAAYLRAVSRAPLPARDAWALYGIIGKEIWANKRTMLSELINPGAVST